MTTPPVIFVTEAGDLSKMLRRQIDDSNGVIQLIGQCVHGRSDLDGWSVPFACGRR